MTPTILVTGASRGIGLELCRQYCTEGLANGTQCQVIATCRDINTAQKLNALKQQCDAELGNLSIVELDVTNTTSITNLLAYLDGRAVDILINNAGNYGPNAPLLPVDIERWQEIFRLNCIAPIHLTQQLFENIKRSNLKKVIAISSDMGSIASNVGGGAYLYRSSKAGLNAAMHSLSLDVKQFGITVLMIHPGHVKTDLGGPNAKIELPDSVFGVRNVIDKTEFEQSGTFKNWLGETMLW